MEYEENRILCEAILSGEAITGVLMEGLIYLERKREATSAGKGSSGISDST